MANKLLKMASNYIGTNAPIEIDIPATSTNVSGVATDRSGNIYIADTEQHVIYKVDTKGNSYLIAGAVGVPGYVNGIGTASRFYSPRGLACDASGNLYVADTGNGRIRVIDIGLKCATLSGGFTGVVDVSVGPNGDIIAVDKAEHCIYRIEPGGRKFIAAGDRGSDGDEYGMDGNVKVKGSAAMFSSPEAATVAADGKIYVADVGNGSIKVIDTDGWVNKIGETSENVQDLVISPKGNTLFFLAAGGIYSMDMDGDEGVVASLGESGGIGLTVDMAETIYAIVGSSAPIEDEVSSASSVSSES